ncbi:MAG: 23S rRNA pseudouridine(1911/1915/1917) synthase RluD [Candidatus Competibacterales bacterium]|nr:23S rRNA pseudouridine(1911/1915/1917) synthase RluD [Candidatus Competibacterales bacterium]
MTTDTGTGGEAVACRIPAEYAGRRLDQALAGLLTGYSRSQLQQWLRDGWLRLDGRQAKPNTRLLGGERVSGHCPRETVSADLPQAIPLSVRFEDDHLLVVDKPAGLVVHPAAGNPDGTLVNALLHHAPGLAALPRAGIVHRLDKDTSGLLVVARTTQARTALVEQLQARRIEREYRAVVVGVPAAGGTVEAPVGRHPVDRKRMAVVPGGRPALTRYRVLERFRTHALLAVRLETGRTHQIRIHMAYIRYPLVGDPVYGGRSGMPPRMAADHAVVLRDFRRQALHACRLALRHPVTGQWLEWHADPPADLGALLAALRADARDPHGPV